MKVALVDVDGVLAAQLEKTLTDLGGRLQAHHITAWDIYDFLDEDEIKRLQQIWSDPEWWATLPLVEGAQAGVQMLRDHGYEIVVVSTPWLGTEAEEHLGMGMERARRRWLRKHFDIDPRDVIFAKPKHHVRGDLFIDDKASMIEEWSDHPRRHPTEFALLFDAPYNRDQDVKAPRLQGWADLPRALIQVSTLNATNDELRKELRDHMTTPGYFGLRPDVSTWSREWLVKAVADVRRVMAQFGQASLGGKMTGDLLVEPTAVGPLMAFNSESEIAQLHEALQKSQAKELDRQAEQLRRAEGLICWRCNGTLDTGGWCSECRHYG